MSYSDLLLGSPLSNRSDPLSMISFMWASHVALVVKNLPDNAADLRAVGLIPRLGRSLGGGHALPTPKFLPGEFHGQRSLAGYNPQGFKESDMTEAT